MSEVLIGAAEAWGLALVVSRVGAWLELAIRGGYYSHRWLWRVTMGRRNVIILEQRPEDLDALPPALRRKVSWASFSCW
ncbi:hypothetical protein CISG_02607 [Coccidioides immitis RMSCC 3703]|uniref:Uncharacterized protein n=1 Tax=Coccidioides immitis RMSCC 3703 TaxID=454286 RepID=A0A0J8R9Y4_COCIT|nr:hypothetical protein CISG_02607 [Coccidioides immitis RMSCC 3703]